MQSCLQQYYLQYEEIQYASIDEQRKILCIYSGLVICLENIGLSYATILMIRDSIMLNDKTNDCY